jgi:uncharacterized protein with ATP-grasp and redox domains
MKTYLDCLPCFMRQALGAARVASDDEHVHRRVLDSVASMIPQFSLELTPPEIAQQSYRLAYQIIGNSDPFHQAKVEANQMALSIYPHLKEVVADSADPLLTACRLAVAANYIDLIFGGYPGDPNEIVERALASPLDIDDYAEFRNSIDKSRRILYLGDNAGEIVFDRVLIEELRQFKELEIIFVVRRKPIINDATMDDAVSVGLDKVTRIIDNGSDAPGTVLAQCSPEMLKHYHSADTIVVKGQGNYESLNEERKNIFFLMRVKCPVAARLLGANLGDAVLKQQMKG